MNHVQYCTFSVLLSSLLVLLAACGSGKDLTAEASPFAPKEILTEKSVALKEVGKNYQIWNGITFVASGIDRKVIYPNGGNLAYLEAVYSALNYPPKARYNDISGTVLIELIVDELGYLEAASVKSGIGYGCDEEALKVVKMASEAGFQPALQGNRPVKVKFELPVVFRL